MEIRKGLSKNDGILGGYVKYWDRKKRTFPEVPTKINGKFLEIVVILKFQDSQKLIWYAQQGVYGFLGEAHFIYRCCSLKMLNIWNHSSAYRLQNMLKNIETQTKFLIVWKL